MQQKGAKASALHVHLYMQTSGSQKTAQSASMKLVEVTFPRRKSERNSTLTVLMLVEMCTL